MSSPIRIDSSAVQWREVDGEVVAVDLRNSRYMAANASATGLWPLLARGTTLPELSAALVQRWSLTEEVARRDAEQLVTWLGETGLLLDPPEADQP